MSAVMGIDDILDIGQRTPGQIADGFTVTAAAEILSRDEHASIGPRQLFQQLEHAAWILREPVNNRWVPTSRALANGWAVVDPIVIRRGPVSRDVVPQVRITLDGLRALREHLAPPDVVPPPTLFD